MTDKTNTVSVDLYHSDIYNINELYVLSEVIGLSGLLGEEGTDRYGSFCITFGI